MGRSFMLFCCLPIAMLVGCNSSPTAPVSGTVTIDGQPAPENTRVTFQPKGDTGQVATGLVDSSGNYELFSGAEGLQGAEPGTYTVYLSPDMSDVSYMESGGGAPPKADLGSIPKEYTSADTSPKTVEVTAGENTIAIEI
jgi:hypothetical protein